MGERAEGRLVSLIAAPPGCKAYYAPQLAGYDGGDELPQIVEEPVLAFGLVERGANHWTEALVNNDDYDDGGALMTVTELPGFLATEGPSGTGFFPAQLLTERINSIRKARGVVKPSE